jgi:hypothetical protein
MEFQLSGEVSDETAQSIGHKLEAQTIQNIDVRQDSRIGALTGTGYTIPIVPSINNTQKNNSAIIIPK